MPLSPGDNLGPYEILEAIGKGGMGEVYRARDPRLQRDVAIKVSAQRFNERFEREARAVAALNHPNICQIYDVGPNYLVMELIEGPTLGEIIKQGPIALDEALRIAGQIGDALADAHEKLITHRDLKPGNVKVKEDGLVKVLDFGLAKIGNTPTAAPLNSEESPTLSMTLTQVGMILGTAAYMSPEQARGKPVDARADIWAFGVVLYEMLTGQRPFKGEDLGDTLASVVKELRTLAQSPPRLAAFSKRACKKTRGIACKPSATGTCCWQSRRKSWWKRSPSRSAPRGCGPRWPVCSRWEPPRSPGRTSAKLHPRCRASATN